MTPSSVPTEPMRIAHPDSVNLAERAGSCRKWVARGDAVLAIGAVPAFGVNSQDLPVWQREVLRIVIRGALTAVAYGDIQQAVIPVSTRHRGVEVDLLNPMDLASESDPEHFSVLPLKCGG